MTNREWLEQLPNEQFVKYVNWYRLILTGIFDKPILNENDIIDWLNEEKKQ